MSDTMYRALKNAAASSAMEGLPLTEDDIAAIIAILEGEMTLQDYFSTLTESAEKPQ